MTGAAHRIPVAGGAPSQPPRPAPSPSPRPDLTLPGLGPATRLIVALHGYGGRGGEIRDRLRDGLRATGRTAAILAPDGDGASPLVPAGRSWYAVTAHVAEMGRRSVAPAAALADRLAGVQQALGVPAAGTAVVAFSQGTTVAKALLDAGEREGGPGGFARAVLVCGRLPGPPLHRTGQPPAVLVVTGAEDRFAPPDAVRADLDNLAAGSRLRFLVLPGLRHEFRSDVAALAVRFACGDPDPYPADDLRGPCREASHEC